jgi:hypothetical protein
VINSDVVTGPQRGHKPASLRSSDSSVMITMSPSSLAPRTSKRLAFSCTWHSHFIHDDHFAWMLRCVLTAASRSCSRRTFSKFFFGIRPQPVAARRSWRMSFSKDRSIAASSVLPTSCSIHVTA